MNEGVGSKAGFYDEAMDLASLRDGHVGGARFQGRDQSELAFGAVQMGVAGVEEGRKIEEWRRLWRQGFGG